MTMTIGSIVGARRTIAIGLAGLVVGVGALATPVVASSVQARGVPVCARGAMTLRVIRTGGTLARPRVTLIARSQCQLRRPTRFAFFTRLYPYGTWHLVRGWSGGRLSMRLFGQAARESFFLAWVGNGRIPWASTGTIYRA